MVQKQTIPRGCTAINSFTFPYSASQVQKLYITYQQNGETVFEKELSDCSFGENTVSVWLTQEDTLALMPSVDVEIQIRAKLTDDTAIKSNILKRKVDNVLKGGII